jgi:hypothetical protein
VNAAATLASRSGVVGRALKALVAERVSWRVASGAVERPRVVAVEAAVLAPDGGAVGEAVAGEAEGAVDAGGGGGRGGEQVALLTGTQQGAGQEGGEEAVDGGGRGHHAAGRARLGRAAGGEVDGLALHGEVGVGVRLREERRVAVHHGVPQAQRAQDAVADRLAVRGPGGLLDNQAEQDEAGVVVGARGAGANSGGCSTARATTSSGVQRR